MGKALANTVVLDARVGSIDLTITRVFAADPAMVYRAWTDPTLLRRWACPKEMTVESAESDARVGGVFRCAMREPGAGLHVMRGVYRELSHPRRIVLSHGWEGEGGVVGSESLITIDLAPHPRGTRMVFRQVGLASVASRDGHADGWNSAFENLGGVCGAVPPADTSGPSLKVETPTDTTIVMTRSFRSPRETVWRAMTEPGLLRRWLFSPPGWTMTSCEGEAVVGGPYRWAWDDAEGNPTLSIHGVWTEVRPPWRVAHTETMGAGACGVVGSLVATIELAEAAGETVLTITLEFGSKEARDGALASGMDRGMEAGYAALDKALPAF